MGKQKNFILDFYVVQVTPVGNSWQMEKAGLKNLFKKFDKKEIKISALVTDRHFTNKIVYESGATSYKTSVWYLACR